MSTVVPGLATTGQLKPLSKVVGIAGPSVAIITKAPPSPPPATLVSGSLNLAVAQDTSFEGQSYGYLENFSRWSDPPPGYRLAQVHMTSPYWVGTTAAALYFWACRIKFATPDDSYQDGSAFDGAAADPITVTAHVKNSDQSPLICRIGVCNEGFTEKVYNETTVPMQTTGDGDVTVTWTGTGRGWQPCYPFLAFEAPPNGTAAMWWGNWTAVGPRYLLAQPPPPPPAHGPPGKVYPGAHAVGHFPLR